LPELVHCAPQSQATRLAGDKSMTKGLPHFHDLPVVLEYVAPVSLVRKATERQRNAL